MGHEHHFLSRLDRVSLPHVELALSIYRDHELLRFVLEKARLPEGAPRVAISLDHPENGPFIIVTREGRFVTCLGEGMSPGDWPLLTRGRFDGLAAQMSDHRARKAERDRLLGSNGKTVELLKRINEAGPELSREEFMAIASFEPLLRTQFLRLMFDAALYLLDCRDALLLPLRRTEKLNASYRPLLKSYWHTFWALGHFAMLASMGGPAIVEVVPPLATSDMPAFSALVEHGIIALALKGVWSASKLGKPILGSYKRMLASPYDTLSHLNAVLSLTGIGLRHSRLQAEIRKAIASPRQVDAWPGDRNYAKVLNTALIKLTTLCFDEGEEMTKLQHSLGAEMLVERTRTNPAGSAHRYERIEDVPTPLALTVAVQNQAGFITSTKDFPALFCCLPWLAHAEPEMLYLPADVIKAVHIPWAPERTIDLLRGLQKAFAPDPPQKPEGPSRQGPCPCGSGKKYKRCCEA